MTLHRLGNHFCQAIGVGIGHLKDARDVAHGVPGRHPTKSHDVGDAFGAVFLNAVLNDLVAPGVLNVNIDIGHADTVGVQKAFEQQIILERVEFGDLEGVRNNRTGRAAPPRTKDDAFVFAPADKVRDNQEITVKAHLVDNAEFVAGPLHDVCRQMGFGFGDRQDRGGVFGHTAVAPSQAAVDQFVEVRFFILAFGHRKLRDQNPSELDRHVTASRDIARIGD